MNTQTIRPATWLEHLSQTPGSSRYLRCRRWSHQANRYSTPRCLENHLLLLVLEGELRVRVDDWEKTARAGTAVWCPPGTTREISSRSRSRKGSDYRLHFDVWHKNGTALRFASGAALRTDAAQLQFPLAALAELTSQPSPQGDVLAHGLLLAVAATFLRLPRTSHATRRQLTRHQQRVIRQRLEEDSARPTPADLAHHLSLSPDYFSRLFRATYGCPPRAFLKTERIRTAAHLLLESSRSVKEVASDLGYRDSNLFCRQFRAIMGCSPGQYRRHG